MLCGVAKESSEWPVDPTIVRANAATGEVYFNPFFAHSVLHDKNIELFDAVADGVMMDLKVRVVCKSEQHLLLLLLGSLCIGL